MKMKSLALIAMIAAVLVLGAPAFAHHGDTAYSPTAQVLKGCVVTAFNWMNPHSLIKFDYKTDKGDVQHWSMEIGSTPSMTLLGWSRNTLRPGDVFTAYVYQSKTGNFVGRTNKIVLSDGTVLTDRDNASPARYGGDTPAK
jgi:Family of unknown function (DUF6152)